MAGEPAPRPVEAGQIAYRLAAPIHWTKLDDAWLVYCDQAAAVHRLTGLPALLLDLVQERPRAVAGLVALLQADETTVGMRVDEVPIVEALEGLCRVGLLERMGE